MTHPDYDRYWDEPLNERRKRSREKDEDDVDVPDEANEKVDAPK